MIRERANPKPLHNFALPRLRWGNQKQARCMKVVDHSAWPLSSSSSTLISAVRHRPLVLPSFVRTGLPAALSVDAGEGIEAVREKLMLDLRAETDKFKKELLKGDDEEEETAAVAGEGKMLTDAAATARLEEDHVDETRPWSLRTRRATRRTPASGLAAATADDSPARKEGVSVVEPTKGSPDKRKGRVKFAVSLRKKEIEEDFVKLTGRRPSRRPKKRRGAVQKKLDMLFPGQWLTEVTADVYMVAEVVDNVAVKRSRST